MSCTILGPNMIVILQMAEYDSEEWLREQGIYANDPEDSDDGVH